ncbi:unnamed protein product [Clavelina lepadiformis]|uniref:TBC1 domain family member 2B n=1 Tax=Clavelina lepadiformis TaxID=159417 RepID=A0ABP0FEJ0_CLALP
MDCPTGTLINLNDEEGSSSNLVRENSQERKGNVNKKLGLTPLHLDQSNKTDSTLSDVKEKVQLCGYLSKISYNGPIKSSRTRWFTYNPDSCEMIYYRSSGSDGGNVPVGKIPLRRASFNFSASDLSDNIFTVTSDGTTHTLQACDRKTLLWWLQELQAGRRSFNLKQSDETKEQEEWHGTILGSSLFWVPNVNNTSLGLLDVRPGSKSPAAENEKLEFNIVPHLEAPPDTVGEQAATLHKPRSATLLSQSALSSLSNKIPNLGTLNTAFSNVGEAAMKGLRSQAQKLRPPSLDRRLSETNVDGGTIQKSLSASSSASNLSTMGKEINYQAFVSNLKETIQHMREEIILLKNKLDTKEEAIEMLKLELQKYENLQAQLSKFDGFSETDYKLRSEVIGLKLSNEGLEQDKQDAAKREEELKERVGMLEEMLKIKDDVVVQLSNEVFQLESSNKSLTSDHRKLKKEKNEEFVILTPADASEHIDELKTKVDGYTMQNKFLNNEILELSNLRQVDAKRLQSLQDKVHQQEAEHCQLHSKYLVLLSEMNKPRTESVGLAVAGTKIETSDSDRREMVKILIKEALTDSELKHIEDSDDLRKRKYDQYGFSQVVEDDAESSLLTAASRLEKRSSDILQSLSQYKTSIAVKWQNFLTINKELQRGEDLKALVRLGVPHELRPQVWSWMVNIRTSHIRQKLELDRSYYKDLVHSKEAQLPSKQIELDLLRTLPNNRHFSSLSSSGIDQLRRVLRAYSIHNPSIGYCQGLNRIVAVSLLYLCEEEAFWCLVAIVECIMPPDYYSTTLTASQADQRVFRDLMAEKLPRLHRHLETAGVDSSLITFNWLLCIYCDNVPPDTMLHIWDCLLYEGSKVLFRFGLAFFKYVEDEILQLGDYMAIFNFLRNLSFRMYDVKVLAQTAFSGMNPFPMRKITRLRQIHMEKVRAELRELDNIRSGFTTIRREARRELDSDED